jgi:hypothetical protein
VSDDVKPIRRKLACCRRWEDDVTEAQRREWPWQVVHEFGHSRIPFTVATLADRARVDEDVAGALADEALARDFLRMLGPGLYVGALQRKR